MTKTKKRIIIIASVLLVGILAYVGAWLYYYYAVCLPHIPDASYGFEFDPERPAGAGLSAYYAPPDEYEHVYSYSVPSFGHFRCTFRAVTTIGCNDDHCIVNADGSKQYIMYDMGGTDYTISMFAALGFDGDFNFYGFNANKITDSSVCGYFELNADGELINEDELVYSQLKIYEELLPVFKGFIEKINAMAGV